MAEFKYIDKTELMGKIYENPAVEHNMRCVQLLSAIRTVPTYDAVEVVRCKDCKHCAIREYDIMDELECEIFDVFTDPLDYCSHGERKEK